MFLLVLSDTALNLLGFTVDKNVSRYRHNQFQFTATDPLTFVVDCHKSHKTTISFWSQLTFILRKHINKGQWSKYIYVQIRNFSILVIGTSNRSQFCSCPSGYLDLLEVSLKQIWSLSQKNLTILFARSALGYISYE